jgi:hypothetical protein
MVMGQSDSPATADPSELQLARSIAATAAMEAILAIPVFG